MLYRKPKRPPVRPHVWVNRPDKKTRKRRNAQVKDLPKDAQRPQYIDTPAGRLHVLKIMEKGKKTSNRVGVPDGWTRASLSKVLDDYRDRARRIVRRMAKNDELPVTDERAEEVLSELHAAATAQYIEHPETGQRISVMEAVRAGVLKPADARGYVYPLKDRISAAKVFLDFTKEKPKTTTDVNVSPEAFLEALALTEETDDGSETPEGTEEA